MSPSAFDGWSQPALATIAREYLMCGHLIDRAAMPYLIARWGREEMRDIAIDEWMGASPVYTRRMQQVLGFEGDDVTTIFKGMQFDIGAPHEFLDFRYTVHDAHHGEFQLDHCGALMDVEPMGEDFVRTMCHDIEDPTFDATAAATNPRARVRPLHRPPREPAGREPHCAWTVTIDPDAAPIHEAPVTRLVADTTAARTPVARTPSSGQDRARGGPSPGGLLEDYSGPLLDPIDLSAFSAAVLEEVCGELCLQQHLLAAAFMAAVEQRHGRSAAQQMGAHQMVGAAGIGASRLVRIMGSPGDASVARSRQTDALSLARAARVFELHPLLQPGGYVDASVHVHPGRIEIQVGPSVATADPDELSWVNLLVGSDPGATPDEGATAGERALGSIAAAVDRRARCRRVDGGRPGAPARFEVHLGDQEVPRHEEVTLASMSTGAGFGFDRATPVVLGGRRGT